LNKSILLSATVTVLIAVFYFFASMRVGVLRGRLGVKAPATAGHPQFDRAYRVQLNTLEQLGIILPLLWIATFFPTPFGWLPALIALIWLAARVVYMAGYMADPDKRLAGAGLSGLSCLALLATAVTGLVMAWTSAPA